MEFKFEITEDDYIQFNLYHVENSPAHKKTCNFLRYAIPVLFSVPIYYIGQNLFKQPRVYWIIIAILFAIVWIVTYPKQYRNLVKRQTKKILDEGDNSSIFGKKTIILNENDIKVFSEFTSEIISKKSVKDVKVYDDMILIYISGFMAQIVPTRYLDEESQKNFIKELGIL